MTTADVHEPVPLSHLVTGTLTLHFAGAKVERRMSLAEARTINAMNDDKRNGDQLHWSDLCWFQYASEKVLACDFTPDEDLGFGLTSTDRAALTKHGHPHGILRTLVDHWRTRGTEPSYSRLAIFHLSKFAAEGTSGDDLTSLIDALEGDAGRKLLHDPIARTPNTPTRRGHTSSSDTRPSHPTDSPVDSRQNDGPLDSPSATSPGDEPVTEPGPDDDPNSD